MHKRALWSIIAAFAFLLSSFPARANDLLEIRPLSFGVFSVQGAAPQTIEVDPDGTTPTPTSGILRFRRGSNAVYQMTELPPNTPFTTSIADTTLNGSSGSRIFDITNFQVIPDNASNPQADASGNATMKIGATLTTRAGVTYTPGAYRGTYDLMINF